MNNEVDRSIVQPEYLSPQVLDQIKIAISNRVFRYAMDANLGTTREDQQIAVGILSQAFQDGFERVDQFKQSGKNTRVINAVIDRGLEKRKQLITTGREMIKQLQHEDAFIQVRVPLFEALAIDRSRIALAREELHEPKREVVLEHTRALIHLVEERRETLSYVGKSVFSTILDVPQDHPVFLQNEYLFKDPTDTSRIINGFIVSRILNIYYADIDWDPLYISNDALDKLIGITTEIRQDTGIQQAIVRNAASTLGLSEEHSEKAREFLDLSLKQILNLSSNWNTPNRQRLDRSTPYYWEKLREFFTNLPLSPVQSGYQFGFSPELAEQNAEQGIGHLWQFGVRFGDVVIPSAQDLSSAEHVLKVQIRNNMISEYEYDTLYQSIKYAKRAWKTYLTVQHIPEQLSPIRQALEESLPLIPEDLLFGEEKKRPHDLDRVRKKHQRHEAILKAEQTLKDLLSDSEKKGQRVKIQRYYHRMKKAESKKKLSETEHKLYDFLEKLQKPLVSDFAVVIEEGNFPGFNPENEDEFNVAYEAHKNVLSYMRESGNTPEDFKNLVKQYPQQFKRFLQGLPSPLAETTFLRESSIDDLSESHLLRKALQQNLVERVRQFRRYKALTERKLRLKEDLHGLKEYYAAIGIHDPISASFSTYVPGTEERELGLRILPDFLREPISLAISGRDRARAKDFVESYKPEYNFQIPEHGDIEAFMQEYFKDANGHAYHTNKYHYYAYLARSSSNPYIPTKDASGLWLSSLVEATQSRLEIADTLIHWNQTYEDYQSALQREREYRRYAQYRSLITKVNYLQTKLNRLQWQYDGSEEVFLRTMREFNFVVSADAPFIKKQ